MEDKIAEEMEREDVIPLDLAIERELECRRRAMEKKRRSKLHSHDVEGLLDLTEIASHSQHAVEDADSMLRSVVVERSQLRKRLVEAVEKMRKDMPLGEFVPVALELEPPPSVTPLKRESFQRQPRSEGSSTCSEGSFPTSPPPPPTNRQLLDLRCQICRVHCMSAFSLQQHFQSKKHSEKCQEYDQQLMPHQRWQVLHCDICQVTCFTAFDLHQHFQKEEHLQKCQEYDREPAADGHGQQLVNLYCNICQVRCSGEFNLQQHLKGQKHLTKCSELNMDNKEKGSVGGVWCDECRIQCPDMAALMQHRAGRKHVAQLRAIEEWKTARSGK